jgi:hypothetical protein
MLATKPWTAVCHGLWLDQAGAVIVSLRGDGDSVIRRIESEVDPHYRVTGGTKSGTFAMDISDERRVERRRKQQLERYHKRLAGLLEGADEILILGPGDAKLGLYRVLMAIRDRPAPHVRMETASRMTDNQLVALVRKRFSRD